MAPLVRTGGSRHTGLAALPHRNIQYPRAISGEMVYGDICDQIEGKENGSYVLLSKVEDDVIFEYHITVMDDEFNLGLLTIRTPEGVFETDFDK